MEERRQDMNQLMQAMRDQNNILAAQNTMLKEILGFIKPVSDFFSALKNFVVFIAWCIGLLAAGVAAWQIFISWMK